MSDSSQIADFRISLARDVQRAVEREAHFTGSAREVIIRATESLVLDCLERFKTAQDLEAIQAWRPYLARAARRTLLREERNIHQSREAPSSEVLGKVALAPEEANPEREVQERHEYFDLMAKVDRGLRLLSLRERQVLDLRMKGLTYAAIAGILGVTRDSAYVHASTATSKLRRMFRAPA
jgi:RNA polymerase sigma factor (sigma-70 family)